MEAKRGSREREEAWQVEGARELELPPEATPRERDSGELQGSEGDVKDTRGLPAGLYIATTETLHALPNHNCRV